MSLLFEIQRLYQFSFKQKYYEHNSSKINSSYSKFFIQFKKCMNDFHIGMLFLHEIASRLHIFNYKNVR